MDYSQTVEALILWFKIIDLYTLRHSIDPCSTFDLKMGKEITREELTEIESLLAPLVGRMDKVIRDYILASRSHAAVMPRGDSGADDVFEDSYDMGCVIDLLEFLKRLQNR